VPASHLGGLSSVPGKVTWDVWWTQRHWDEFFHSTSVSPASSHSFDCCTSADSPASHITDRYDACNVIDIYSRIVGKYIPD
jgi:hypothetical protein